MTKTYSPYPFRMPTPMREEIESKAKASNRSLQQEMLKRLDLTLNLERAFNQKIESLESYIYSMNQQISLLEQSRNGLELLVEKLEQKNKLIMSSLRIEDADRFQSIRRLVNQIQFDIDKIEKLLPPEEVVNKSNKKGS